MYNLLLYDKLCICPVYLEDLEVLLAVLQHWLNPLRAVFVDDVTQYWKSKMARHSHLSTKFLTSGNLTWILKHIDFCFWCVLFPPFNKILNIRKFKANPLAHWILFLMCFITVAGSMFIDPSKVLQGIKPETCLIP